MASGNESQSVNCHDFTKCAICFEEFKSPKYLPCSHSFCRECLSGHIVSSCESKNSPVGFCCPLCRDFIPVENFTIGFKDWADQFPTNDKLGKISSEENLCDACNRDGDQEKADKFCLLCKDMLCNTCAKYHRRLLADDHKVVTFDDMRSSPVTMALGKLCSKHEKKKVKYFCKNHLLPCCTTCAFIEHRNCAEVETVSETADRFRVQEHGKLSDNMESLEKELENIKEELEKNISDIEEKSTDLSENAEELYTKLQRHIEQLKNDYLNQLSMKTKECKNTLQEHAIAVGDKVPYIKQCRKSLDGLKEETEDSIFVRQFHENSRKYENLKDKHKKHKSSIKLLQLKSRFDYESFEKSNYFGGVDIETLKEYYIPPTPIYREASMTTVVSNVRQIKSTSTRSMGKRTAQNVRSVLRET